MNETCGRSFYRPNAPILKISVLVLVTVCSSCTQGVRVLKHDPIMATQEAEKFVVPAFVERDFRKAYALLPAEMQKLYSMKAFEAEMVKLHPSGYPTAIAGTEFEPIPGHPAMNVFFVGENTSEKFYYRITMVGTVDSGYIIGGFWRGSGPYPPSKMRRALESAPGQASTK